MEKGLEKNKWTFGLGTIGRDMLYTLVSMYLIFYLTDVAELPTHTLWWVTGILFGARVFDAVNDPIMGVIVDNTHTRFGKFKPWIAIGGVLASILTVLLFTDFGLEGAGYIAVFAVLYLLWGLSYTANDIAYWSMLPSLSVKQEEREVIGSVARICANIGLFIIVAGIVPITTWLGEVFGSPTLGYTVFAGIIAVLMLVGTLITLFFVKEPDVRYPRQERTTLGQMLHIIFGNDQLLYTAIAMSLFNIGYCTTTSFGLYYFKYVYGDEGMYTVFAVILGVAQIGALAVFPFFAKRFERRQLYAVATVLVIIGYVVFFFAPTHTMRYIGVAGLLLFVGQAFIQILMLMFLADTVEYGYWKRGKRNESVTFALQPFINKMGGAVASGIVGVTIILSGIKDATSKAEVTAEGLMLLKSAMMLLPLVSIVIGFVVYLKKYKIDRAMYAKILEDLAKRR